MQVRCSLRKTSTRVLLYGFYLTKYLYKQLISNRIYNSLMPVHYSNNYTDNLLIHSIFLWRFKIINYDVEILIHIATFMRD